VFFYRFLAPLTRTSSYVVFSKIRTRFLSRFLWKYCPGPPVCLNGRKKSTHAWNSKIIFFIFPNKSSNICIYTRKAISTGIVRFRGTKRDGRTAAVNYILYIYTYMNVDRPECRCYISWNTRMIMDGILKETVVACLKISSWTCLERPRQITMYLVIAGSPDKTRTTHFSNTHHQAFWYCVKNLGYQVRVSVGLPIILIEVYFFQLPIHILSQLFSYI
jgi:hypothetical protein